MITLDPDKYIHNLNRDLEKIFLIILIIFALNAFSLNLGYMSPIFSRLCGFFALVFASALLYYNSGIHITKKRIFIFGICLIFLSLIMLLLSLRVELWLASLAIFLCGFDLILRSNNADLKEIPPLIFGSIIYNLIYIVIYYNSFIWKSIQLISLFLSNIIGMQRGITLALGPSVEGLFVFLSFLFFSVSFLAFSEKDRAALGNFFSLIISLIVLFIIYIYLQTTTWLASEKAIYSLYILFITLSFPFLAIIRRFRLKTVSTGSSIPKIREGAVLALVFLSLVIVTIFPYSYNGYFGKVVVYEKDCEMNFDLPQFPEDNGYLAPERGFSIGALELYLQNIGYEIVKFDSNAPRDLKDVLKGSNILLLMNLNKPMSSHDLEAIWEFVRNGGGLLIFGEHTSMFASDRDFGLGRDYLNDILSPTGIRINPDTADFFSGAWKYARFPCPHPVTKDLGFGITTSSVGASLSINGGANPVLVGSYAFSDNPNPGEPGHLGNRRYEFGERLGDVILAASDTYGLGNILVFGDTSYILSPEVPGKYKLIDNSIAWLLSKKNVSFAMLSFFSVLLIISAFIYIYKYIKLNDISSYLIIFASLVLAASLIISEGINDSLVRNPQGEEIADIAWIDHVHTNRFDLAGYTSGSIDGLSVNLIRNGYMPLILDDKNDFCKILKGRVSIIIGPTKGYSSEEVQTLKSFVENGGLLIISAGYESIEPLKPLFDVFNINVFNVPLGSPPWIVESHGQSAGVVSEENLGVYWHKPKFMDAYPVNAEGNFTSVASLQHEGSNYNLIISKMFEKGEVVLIGDSRFLLNENLEYLTLGSDESKKDYQLQWLGNIELLKSIISQYKGGR